MSFDHDTLFPVGERAFFVAGYEANADVRYALSMEGRGLIEAFSADNRGQVYVKGYFEDSMRIGNNLLGETSGFQDFFLTLSSHGELLWHRIFVEPGVSIWGLESDKFNNLYVSGAVGRAVSFDSVTFRGGYFLLKLDPAGKAIWGYSFGEDRFLGSNIAIHDQAIYVSGSFSREQVIEDTIIYSYVAFPSHIRFDALLLRHDPQTGELIWFKQIGWTGDDGGGPVKAMPSGELYFLGGFSDNRTYADSLELLNPYPGIGRFWLGKTTADSLAPPVPVPETGWVVYPNPVKEQVWLSGQWEEEKLVQVELFALDGRRVLRKEIVAGSFSNPLPLSVPALRPGMYILRIRQGAQVGSYKILKTQP